MQFLPFSLLALCANFVFVHSNDNKYMRWPEKLREWQGSVQEVTSSTLDPCDDFYEYACDTFKKKNSREAGYNSQLGLMRSIVRSRFADAIKKLDEKKITREEKLMADYYNACMGKYDDVGYEQYFKLQDEYDNVTDFTQYHIKLFPNYIYFKFDIEVDENNISVPILKLHPKYLIFQIYTDDWKPNEAFTVYSMLYKELQVADKKKAVFTGEPGEIERRLKNVDEISKGIQQVSSKHRYLESETIPLGNISDFITLVDIPAYIESIIPEIRNQNISLEDIPVTVKNKKAIQQVDEFLSNLTDRAVNDYLDHLLLTELMPYMGPRFKQMHKHLQFIVIRKPVFDAYIDIVDFGREKRLECVDETMDKFQDVAALHYMKLHVPDEVLNEVMKMTLAIKQEFEETILASDWMDNDTRKEALQKIRAMDFDVGYHQGLMDKEKLQERYADLEYKTPISAYTTAKGHRAFLRKRFLRKLYNKTPLLYLNTLEVNAAYAPFWNKLFINTAIVQEPYFSLNNTLAENYGSVGLVIGHEITHGFDNSGAEYDASGIKRNWWKSDAQASFDKKADCFTDQYDQFGLDGSFGQKKDSMSSHVSGKYTLGENIVDNGGFATSFKAFKKKMAADKSQLKKVSDRFGSLTPEQVFFLSYGNFWCTNDNKNVFAFDEHSPAKVRVNAVVQNQPEFYAAFNCQNTSKIYKKDKCKLW